MKQQRPVYLNLLQIRLPLPGLVSILHRASGILLFLLLPVLLWQLSQSLATPGTFAYLQNSLADCAFLRFLIWFTLSALVYHLIAGVRHLVMDVGLGDSLRGGRFGAYVVLILSAVIIVLMGIWLW